MSVLRWSPLSCPIFSTISPKAATVSTDSDVGVGRMVTSSVRRLVVTGLGVASRDASETEWVLVHQ